VILLREGQCRGWMDTRVSVRCMRCIPSRASFHSLRIGIVNNGCVVLQEGREQIGRRPEGASSAVLPGAYRLIDYLLPGPSAQVLPFLRAWLDPRLPLSNARVERGVSSGAARRVATEDHQPVDPPRRCHTHVLLYSPPASRAFLRFWGSVSAGAMYWQFCSNS
jgi:hypothetical protein